MSSKKRKNTNSRKASSVNWVKNKDGTHTIATISNPGSVDSQKSNRSWANLVNPQSEKGRSVRSDENANARRFEKLTLTDAKNNQDDDTDSNDEYDSKILRLIEMTSGKLEMCALPTYEVPKEIWDTEKSKTRSWCNFPTEMYRQKSAAYYVNMYKRMVYSEEATQTLFVQSFNQDDVEFFYTGENTMFYFLNETRMLEICAAMDENLLDMFRLKSHNRKNGVFFDGQIKRKTADKIFVEISEENFSQFKLIHAQQSFDIEFYLNRTPYQLQHFSLDVLYDQQLYEVLINNLKYNAIEDYHGTKHEILTDFKSKLNPEQRFAVQNIVNTTSYPLPYVLFGPPGTGKTRTLVAAIEQIVQLTDKNVLVCAQSNAACDEIAERLIPSLSTNQMFRMYAQSFDANRLKSNIAPYSNYTGREFYYPSLRFLKKYRVLICTLCTAGTLTRARLNPAHFSYVIIDENASSHETMSLIPIVGLCTRTGKILAQIVLAGDPKQLDAVTKSENAKDLGFQTSFMEHLCERKLYKCNPETKTHNGKYITQLIRNYRSHGLILKIPNDLFYNGTLLACASNDATKWFINHSILPSKHFPIIFRSVQGNSQSTDVNKSLFNMNEVKVVTDYIEKLLNTKLKNGKMISQSDIGIVTPYKMQRRCIAQACHRHNLNDITIGTAEVFQGQEKPIMIVSTVRSGGNKLGFVNNPRRFNVMITRAKCLLIIVGDPHLLQYDKNWRRLITFCLENNALIQSSYRYP